MNISKISINGPAGMPAPEIPTLKLSEDNIREETMTHSSDILQWSLYATRLRHRMEDASMDLQRKEADLYEQARSELYILDGKAPTEKRIASYITSHPDYQRLEQACRMAKSWYDEAKCVLDALHTKTTALKSLTYATAKAGIIE